MREGHLNESTPMDPIPDKLTCVAEWDDDCCGKKDYDGPVCSVSTRYWPRGGGHFIVHATPGREAKIEGNEARPEVKPSATSHLLINFQEDDGLGGVLIEKDFEAETFEEVKAQVEAWSQEQMDRAVAALRREFNR